MQSTPSLPLLSGLHWPGVVACDRVLSMVIAITLRSTLARSGSL